MSPLSVIIFGWFTDEGNRGTSLEEKKRAINLPANSDNNKQNDDDHSNTNTDRNPFLDIAAARLYWFLCW